MAVKKNFIKEDLVEKPKNSTKKIIIWIGVCTIMVVLLAGNVYFLWQNRQLSKNLNLDKREVDKQEAQEIYSKVAKFMELPSEEPVLATIVDKSKLEDQNFFAKAENGDKLLVFSKARQALLFRPSTSKVIEFAPLSLGESSSQEVEQIPSKDPTAAPNPTKPASRSATVTPTS